MIAITFISENANWFYTVLLVALVILFAFWLRAHRSRKQALFGLELEVALHRQRRVMRLMALVVVLAAAVFVVDNLVWPTMPPAQVTEPVATVDFFATPPPTFTNVTPTAAPTVTATLAVETPVPAGVANTPGEPVQTQETLTVTEMITPTAAPSAPAAIGTICLITSPTDGATVSGSVTFVGSADADNFRFYKLEAFGPQTSSTWASLLADVVYTPVRDNVLGQVSFDGWSPGGYSVRVVIVDETSNEVDSCYRSINISAP